MQSYFEGQIGSNLEVYVDDIFVKTRLGSSLILEQEETFTNLRRFNIRLNPKKCTFGVPRDKLLGYIITKCGIEANPDKILAIAKIGQEHQGHLVAYGMPCGPQPLCVPAEGTRSPPVQIIKKSDSFRWTDETQKALISKPPVLASS
jgi:hypothetical protein